MIPKKDSFSLVMIGAWNPSIFSQAWILNNLAEDSQDNIVIAFPLDDPTAPRKITLDGVNIFPGRKLLMLSPVNPDTDGMQLSASIAVKILNLLTHTPIGNLGINFSFTESDNLERLLPLFDMADQASIDAEQYGLVSSSITRSYTLDDGNVLNLVISDSTLGAIDLGFNFHYGVKDITKYRDLLDGTHVIKRYQSCIDFCSGAYGLTFEEDGDGG